MSQSESFYDWPTVKTISQTNFSQVSLKRKGNSSIIQKKIKISSQNKQYVDLEIRLMTDINSPYVVKYYQSITFRGTINKKSIYMPYYSNGDLQSYLLKNQTLSFQEKMKLFIDILEGLSQIHSRFIIHRDLKLKNIFVDESKNCIIGDLGIATVTQSSAQTQIGTLGFQAPDVFSFCSCYDQKIDVWGLGIIAFQLFNPIKNGKLTYPFGSHEEFIASVKTFEGIDYRKYRDATTDISPLDSSVPYKLSYLIQKMLNNNSQKRISWIELYSSEILFDLANQEQKLRLVALKAIYKCCTETKQILRDYKVFINNFLNVYYQKLQQLLYHKKYRQQRERVIVQNNHHDFRMFFYLGMKRMLDKYRYINQKKIYRAIIEFDKKMKSVQSMKNFMEAQINKRLQNQNQKQISKNSKFLTQEYYQDLQKKATVLLKFNK